MKKLEIKNNNIKGRVPYQNGLKTTAVEVVIKEKNKLSKNKIK